MTCVTVKSNLVEINKLVRVLRVGIRDPLACECGPPIRDLVTQVNFQYPTYTLTVTRKGKTTALVAYNSSLGTGTADDGTTDFLIDDALAALPRGLYTGTITRTFDGETVQVDPILTLWIKPPHRHDGVYTTLAGATGDENPS